MDLLLGSDLLIGSTFVLSSFLLKSAPRTGLTYDGGLLPQV